VPIIIENIAIEEKDNEFRGISMGLV